MKKISFIHPPNMASMDPIVPASKALPDWYKKAKIDIHIDGIHNGPWNTAFKGCMPLFDAMTQGYVVPLWADLYIEMKPNPHHGMMEPVFTWGENSPMPLIEAHSPQQVEGLPSIERAKAETAFKFVNPWTVRTPPGYSCLMVPPFNNPSPYFQMFSAIVATDTYWNQINFPFAWTGPDDFEGVIPIGTPLMQIIPFKRVDFKHEIIPQDDVSSSLIKSCQAAITMGFRHTYKRLWRRPVKSI